MLLDESPYVLLDELGSTGLELTRPGLPPPDCYRGHHIQEILDLCLRRDVYLTLVQPMPTLPGKPPRPIYTSEEAEERFQRLVTGNPAILVGRNHAVAWDGYSVYDPNGRIYKITQFGIREAWIKFT